MYSYHLPTPKVLISAGKNWKKATKSDSVWSKKHEKPLEFEEF